MGLSIKKYMYPYSMLHRLRRAALKVEKLNPDYQIDYIENITPRRINEIKKQIIERQERLKNTKMSNR